MDTNGPNLLSYLASINTFWGVLSFAVSLDALPVFFSARLFSWDYYAVTCIHNILSHYIVSDGQVLVKCDFFSCAGNSHVHVSSPAVAAMFHPSLFLSWVALVSALKVSLGSEDYFLICDVTGLCESSWECVCDQQVFTWCVVDI